MITNTSPFKCPLCGGAAYLSHPHHPHPHLPHHHNPLPPLLVGAAIVAIIALLFSSKPSPPKSFKCSKCGHVF